MSSIRDGLVTIHLRNGHACFSSPEDPATKHFKYYFGFVHVYVADRPEPIWDAYVPDKSAVYPANPDSAEKCIEYGVAPPGAVTKVEPRALALDIPYSVFLACTIPPSRGHDRKYMTEFCLRRDDQGQPVVVEAVRNVDTGEYRCLKPGEAEKRRSFWDRLFGRH